MNIKITSLLHELNADDTLDISEDFHSNCYQHLSEFFHDNREFYACPFGFFIQIRNLVSLGIRVLWCALEWHPCAFRKSDQFFLSYVILRVKSAGFFTNYITIHRNKRNKNNL